MRYTNVGRVKIERFGHASFRITGAGTTIYIDPFALDANPAPADLILFTHEHYDHCAISNIKKLKKAGTTLVGPEGCKDNVPGLKPIKEGGTFELKGVQVKAVPAYNVAKRFHPRGLGLGYVLELEEVRLYHAGDTDRIPEMRNLRNITVAMLPIGGTYTMNISEAADAARDISPKIVIPMHYNFIEATKADASQLSKALAGTGIEVRILE